MVKRIAMIGLVGVLLMATTYVMAEEVLATQKGVKYHKETCRLIKNKDNATKIDVNRARLTIHCHGTTGPISFDIKLQRHRSFYGTVLEEQTAFLDG